MTTLYGISNCDTVKRGRLWLTDKGIAYQFHDFKKQGVPDAALEHWIKIVGWERLLNQKGTTWRALDDTLRASVVDGASAKSLLMQHSSAIKRPVVQWSDQQVTVGFNEDDWLNRINTASY